MPPTCSVTATLLLSGCAGGVSETANTGAETGETGAGVLWNDVRTWNPGAHGEAAPTSALPLPDSRALHRRPWGRPDRERGGGA